MDLIELLQQSKDEVPECVGMKIYYVDMGNYCIKFLDSERVIKRIQRGKLSKKMDNPKGEKENGRKERTTINR